MEHIEQPGLGGGEGDAARNTGTANGEPSQPSANVANEIESGMQRFFARYKGETGGGHSTLHESFMKLNPPSFLGNTNAEDAEEWLLGMESILELMNVTSEQKVALGSFMLKENARNWWTGTKRMILVEHPELTNIPWNLFKETFEKQYLPVSYLLLKEREFTNLKQHGASVTNYELKFTSLSRYAPDLVRSEESKCHRFLEGLDLPIRSRLSILNLKVFSELVDKAHIVEGDVKELSQLREKNRQSRVEKRPQSFQGGGSSKFQKGNDRGSRSNQSWRNRPNFNNNSSGRRSQSGPDFRSKAEVLCYRCGNKGHYANECTQSQREHSVLCYRCRQEGHIARDCPKSPDFSTSMASNAKAPGKGVEESSKGKSAALEARVPSRVYAMSRSDAHASPDVVTGLEELSGQGTRTGALS